MLTAPLTTFVLAVTLWSSVHADTIDCYQCQNCPVPFDESRAQKLSNCNYCRTILQYQGENQVKVDKMCAVTCMEKNQVHNGRGSISQCCSTDYCNAAAHVVLSESLMAAGLMVAFSMLFKMLF
ncbi:unnamed protein product [Dicrocoelium dendriticum]|nr:unnamed protein product [Dicrocoelium dendriticum]